MAEATLGDAIGLQEKPNLFGNIANSALASQSAAEARAAAALQKKQEQENADFNNLIKDGDVFFKGKNWHNYTAGAAKAELTDALNRVYKVRSENPNDWHAGVHTEMAGLMERLGKLQNTSNYLFGVEKAAMENKGLVDPEFLKKINEGDFSKDTYRDESGRMVSKGWLNAIPDNIYGVQGDGKGNFSGAPVPNYDFGKSLQGFMDNGNVWTETGMVVRPKKGAPNLYEEVVVKKIDPIQQEAFVDEQITNPQAVAVWQIQNKDRLAQARKANPALNDPRNYSNFVQDEMANDLRSKTVGVREERKAMFHNPQREPKEKVDESVQNVDASSPRTLSVGTNYVTDKGESKDTYIDESGNELTKEGDKYYKTANGKTEEVTVKDPSSLEVKSATYGEDITAVKSAHFSPVKIQDSPSFHVDMETGKSEKPRGAVDYSISSVDKLPYVVDQNGNILTVSDKTKKKIEAKGNGKNIKYGWFANGQEESGTIDGEKNRKSRAIPLTQQVFDELKRNKVNITGVDESELWGKGGNGKTAEKPSNEMQEFVVKGKKYRVPANEVADFKKDMGL